jgi:hypothetical protein
VLDALSKTFGDDQLFKNSIKNVIILPFQFNFNYLLKCLCKSFKPWFSLLYIFYTCVLWEIILGFYFFSIILNSCSNTKIKHYVKEWIIFKLKNVLIQTKATVKKLHLISKNWRFLIIIESKKAFRKVAIDKTQTMTMLYYLMGARRSGCRRRGRRLTGVLLAVTADRVFVAKSSNALGNLQVKVRLWPSVNFS